MITITIEDSQGHQPSTIKLTLRDGSELGYIHLLAQRLSSHLAAMPEVELVNGEPLCAFQSFWSTDRTADDIGDVCTCGNPQMGFGCVCDWVRRHPGNIEYSCEFCGVYSAAKPRCNKCKETQ